VTRTQYAVLASLLPRLSDEDLAALLAESEHIEAQRHTPLGTIVAVLPRLSDSDIVRLRELIELLVAERQAVARHAGAIHAVE
jgi:hypothetical protein